MFSFYLKISDKTLRKEKKKQLINTLQDNSFGFRENEEKNSKIDLKI